jgi:hypothetical protein
MRSPKQHARSERRIYTHRLSTLSLLTLAFFVPVAAGCADQQPPAADEIEADTADDLADDPAPVTGQFATSAETQEATGMTYFTIDEVGETLEVHGFLPDGTEAASAVFENREVDLYATLSVPGASPQVLSVSIASVADGAHLYGTLDGQPFSLLAATDGSLFGGDILPISINLTAAALLSDFVAVSDANLRGPRWWVCAKCAGRIMGVIAGAAILLTLGYVLWPQMGALLQTLNVLGMPALRSLLINAGIGLAAIGLVMKAIEELEKYGDALIAHCTECYSGPNPPPPPPLPPPPPPPPVPDT